MSKGSTKKTHSIKTELMSEHKIKLPTLQEKATGEDHCEAEVGKALKGLNHENTICQNVSLGLGMPETECLPCTQAVGLLSSTEKRKANQSIKQTTPPPKFFL